jgi:proteic killer suppression protein
MELHYKSRKLRKACTEERESDRLWGPECARIVRRRLVQLAAAENLAVIESVRPARLHPLSHRRDGQFAVDALLPLCLIFEPWHERVPTLPDGGVDKAKITAIHILGVEDYSVGGNGEDSHGR